MSFVTIKVIIIITVIIIIIVVIVILIAVVIDNTIRELFYLTSFLVASFSLFPWKNCVCTLSKNWCNCSLPAVTRIRTPEESRLQSYRASSKYTARIKPLLFFLLYIDTKFAVKRLTKLSHAPGNVTLSAISRRPRLSDSFGRKMNGRRELVPREWRTERRNSRRLIYAAAAAAAERNRHVRVKYPVS